MLLALEFKFKHFLHWAFSITVCVFVFLSTISFCLTELYKLRFCFLFFFVISVYDVLIVSELVIILFMLNH